MGEKCAKNTDVVLHKKADKHTKIVYEEVCLTTRGTIVIKFWGKCVEKSVEDWVNDNWSVQPIPPETETNNSLAINDYC